MRASIRSSFLCSTALLVVASCASSDPPRAVSAPAGVATTGEVQEVFHESDPCSVFGRYRCRDDGTAWLCHNGRIVVMACRGPKGCTGRGKASACDDNLALEGDFCPLTVNESYSCSTDHGSELHCFDGRWLLWRTCSGPKRCAVEGDLIHCDDSLADVGEKCVAAPDDANYACSTDLRTEVACDAPSGRFVLSNTCRGQKGCWIADATVHCDQSAAREGDMCRPVKNHSCAEDGKTELQCSPQKQWVKQRDCPNGCWIDNDKREVYCQ